MKKEKTRMTIVSVQRVPNVYSDGGYYYMARAIIKESTGKFWLVRSHSRSKINLLTEKEASDFLAKSVYLKTFEGEKFTELARFLESELKYEYKSSFWDAISKKFDYHNENEEILKNFFVSELALNSTMDEETKISLLKTLNDFKEIHKSPYSFSFYNSNDIDWNHKPEGSLRLANHWNFKSRNKRHCSLIGDSTDVDYGDAHFGWKLCIFEHGFYKILKEFKSSGDVN